MFHNLLNENVLKLVREKLQTSTEPPNSPSTQENTFKPSKVIDYFHRHQPTLEERMAEFKVCHVIDYNHKSNPKLKQFLKDINLGRSRSKKNVDLRRNKAKAFELKSF